MSGRARWIRRALAWGLGIVFVWASVDKIAHPREFARIVYHYQLVGPSAALGYRPANLLAITLPWVEILTGLLLIMGFWRREAGMIAAFLLVLFLIAAGSAMARGIDVAHCGCFSLTGQGRRAGAGLILTDLALLTGALLVASGRPRG